MPYFADVNPAEVGTEYRFSRALAEECWITDQGESERNSTLGKLPCSVRNSDADVKAVHPESINNMLLNNSGSSDTIYRDIASDLSFIGSPSRTTVSLSGDAPPLLPRFNASTFAVRTTCYHYQGCVPPSDPQYNDSFTCDPTFSRGAPRAWFNLSPWNSSQDIRDYETWEDDSWAVYGPYPSFQVDPRNGELIVDSEFGIIEGSLIFVLKCIPSLVEIKYAWANSTMTGLVDEYMANKTLIDILRGPFLSNYSFSDVHLKSFATRLGIGTGAGIYPKEYYTRQYAALLSDIGLSFLGGSIVPRPAINLQVQNETVVTHVPKAALFVLIVFNLWYALLGFCLFLVACYVTAYRGRGADVRAVQQLLTVIGLATAAMDKTRSIPGGNLRIGVEKVEDQWQFKVWDENKDTEGDEHSASAEELLSPNLTGPKGLTSVELTSFGSTLSEEDVQGVVLSEDDIGSRHVQAVGLSDDCSVSRTSSFDRSDLGDHDRRELISQHLLSAERSPHHSEEAPDGSQSPNRDTSSRSSSRAPSRASVDGASDREDVTLMHRE